MLTVLTQTPSLVFADSNNTSDIAAEAAVGHQRICRRPRLIQGSFIEPSLLVKQQAVLRKPE
jgi:hypothetical protein